MTRTNSKYTRIYVNGYEISCQASNIGTVGYSQDAPMVAAYCDEVLNTVLGHSTIQCGPINAFLSPSDTTGIHEVFDAGNDIANIMIAFGTLAIPAAGDPVFAWTMQQGEYTAQGDGVVGVNIGFPNAAYSTVKGYYSPFGKLVHAKGAETAVNSALATIDNGAASTAGGIFAYQLFSSDGPVTLSIDDAADNMLNSDFSALSGATSGVINASTAPLSGMVALGTTATVRRFIRWQIAFGLGATTATFALAFIRGT
jgi:hypothetical protein